MSLMSTPTVYACVVVTDQYMKYAQFDAKEEAVNLLRDKIEGLIVAAGYDFAGLTSVEWFRVEDVLWPGHKYNELFRLYYPIDLYRPTDHCVVGIGAGITYE
jgi:hypothetical protein